LRLKNKPRFLLRNPCFLATVQKAPAKRAFWLLDYLDNLRVTDGAVKLLLFGRYELHFAGPARVERVVGAAADAFAVEIAGTALADDNFARAHLFPVVFLDAKPLGN
jgi:hypothetical protein